MSITECITVTSFSPTNGANERRPDALGETISFGTPTGRACIAAAPSSAPSAPPRHSTPRMRPSAYSRRHVARTPSCISSTAAPRDPARRTSSRSCPPARATSARPTSAAQPGSPRIPESITTGRVPNASRRSRTYAISSPLVSSVPTRAMPTGRPNGSRGRRLDRVDRLLQAVDRVLDVLVVVVLGHRAGPVVAQELLHALARPGLGGVGDLRALRQG